MSANCESVGNNNDPGQIQTIVGKKIDRVRDFVIALNETEAFMLTLLRKQSVSESN